MKWIIGLILCVLAGCTSVPEKSMSRSQQVNVESSEQLEVVKDKETAISPQVLYLLMAAEIAGQRNQYDVALEGYLQAAKHVNDPRLAERAAKIGLFLKDAKKTDEAVALWLKQDEKSLTARKIATLSALRNSDKDEAVKHLTRILLDDRAGFESTLLELTRVLEKEGKAAFVFDVLEEISISHPDQAAVFFVQALLAGQLKDLKVAGDKVDKALSLQPDWNKALILRAQLAAQGGDFVVARETLEKVLEKVPDNEKIKKMLAQILMKTEAFDDAILLYQSTLKDRPGDGESQFAIALILLQQEKDNEAEAYLQNLVNKPAWDAQACFYIGRIEYKKEHYDKALVWFDKVTQGGYVYDASMAAVSVLLKQKDYTEAENRINELLAKFPKQQLNILLLKAEIYNEQKDHQTAFDVLSDALKQFPEHRDLLYTRSLIAEKINRMDVLESDLKKILLKNPEDAGALNALGYTLVDRTERYDEAEQYLQQAIKLQPEEAVIIDSMGWLQFKQGKPVEALKYLRNAYDKQPESEIAAHLAEVLWTMGNKGEATDVFNEALKQSPEDEFLLKFQQRFLDLKGK